MFPTNERRSENDRDRDAAAYAQSALAHVCGDGTCALERQSQVVGSLALGVRVPGNEQLDGAQISMLT